MSLNYKLLRLPLKQPRPSRRKNPRPLTRRHLPRPKLSRKLSLIKRLKKPRPRKMQRKLK